MSNTEDPYCRWLHISDLHLLTQPNADNGRSYFLYGSKGRGGTNTKSFKEGGLRFYIQQNPVDVIVITGDFAFRGDFTTQNLKCLKEFLEDLYQICSDAGGWGWDNGMAMERLFWCPGNHDLNREAYEKRKSGQTVYRKDFIRDLHQAGEFKPGGPDKSLLTQGTFSEIYQIMDELIRQRSAFESHDDQNKFDKFEAQVFRVPKKKTPPVYFVAINTALLAGQVATEEKIEEKISQAYRDFEMQHHNQNNETALAAYQEYHRLLNIRRGEVIDDKKKLCFISEERCGSIETELDKARGIVVLAGHHPFDFFSTDGKSKFIGFAHKNGAKLYIHGHTHVLQNEEVCGAKYNLTDYSIYCVGVGGANLNPDDDYNQLSFSIGTITQGMDASPTISIVQLLFLPQKYGNRRWMQLCEPMTISEYPVRNPFQTKGGRGGSEGSLSGEDEMILEKKTNSNRDEIDPIIEINQKLKLIKK